MHRIYYSGDGIEFYQESNMFSPADSTSKSIGALEVLTNGKIQLRSDNLDLLVSSASGIGELRGNWKMSGSTQLNHYAYYDTDNTLVSDSGDNVITLNTYFTNLWGKILTLNSKVYSTTSGGAADNLSDRIAALEKAINAIKNVKIVTQSGTVTNHSVMPYPIVTSTGYDSANKLITVTGTYLQYYASKSADTIATIGTAAGLNK